VFLKLQALIRDHTEELAKSITTEQVRFRTANTSVEPAAHGAYMFRTFR
jgi:hypothetical protein